jgi:hypothetical protein
VDAERENSPLNDGDVIVTLGAGAAHLGQGWGSRNSASGRTAVKPPQLAQAYS